MGVQAAIAQRNGLLNSIGRSGLNMKYPDEFELYVIALELTDENFITQQYFVFPINPSSIEETEPKLTNIRKTLGGITVLRNTTFVPTQISLSGTFGRNFKVLIGEKYEDFLHGFALRDGRSAKTGLPQFDQTIGNGAKDLFDNRIKTGYGCIKILEDIIQQSTQIDANGSMRRLIFHNPALGNSYLVEPGTLTFKMNEQSNMIWNYSLQLTSVAPLESIFSSDAIKSAAKELAVSGYIQKKVNKTINSLSNLVGKGIDKTPVGVPFI
jgi:hypothetical protein